MICHKTDKNVSICKTNFGRGTFSLMCVNERSSPETQQTHEVMLCSNWHCSPSNSATTPAGVCYTMPDRLWTICFTIRGCLAFLMGLVFTAFLWRVKTDPYFVSLWSALVQVALCISGLLSLLVLQYNPTLLIQNSFLKKGLRNIMELYQTLNKIFSFTVVQKKKQPHYGKDFAVF
jgi:hypothetical protein